MKKNAIHNFDISIQNSADIQSSEQLAQTIIKELAKVSKEINQQQDIEQLWQEQKDQNAFTAISSNTTSSDSEKSIWSSQDTSISKAPNGGGAAGNIDRENSSSGASEGITPSLMRANESLQNLSSTRQVYGLHGQQKLTIPKTYQNTTNDPSVEVIKAEIKNKLYEAIQAEDNVGVKYWTRLSIAFDKGAVAADFYQKDGQEPFSRMYFGLQKGHLSKTSKAEFGTLSWRLLSDLMISRLSDLIKETEEPRLINYYERTIKEIRDPEVNIEKLFAEHDELFLLLKSFFPDLPNSISIQTHKKVYPNLSPQKIYPGLGVEQIYFIWHKTLLNEVEIKSGIGEIEKDKNGKYPKLKLGHWYDYDRIKNPTKDGSTFWNASIYNTLNQRHYLYNTIAQRHAYYSFVDAYLKTQKIVSEWFDAAARVTVGSIESAMQGEMALGSADKDMPNLWYLSDETDEFLRGGNQYLFADNMQNVKLLLEGKGWMSGEFIDAKGNKQSFKNLSKQELDFKLVEFEQTLVQDYINTSFKELNISLMEKTLNEEGITGYKELDKIIQQINENFTHWMAPDIMQDIMQKYFTTNRKVTFNFAKYEDRVKLGQVMVKELYYLKLSDTFKAQNIDKILADPKGYSSRTIEHFIIKQQDAVKEEEKYLKEYKILQRLERIKTKIKDRKIYRDELAKVEDDVFNAATEEIKKSIEVINKQIKKSWSTIIKEVSDSAYAIDEILYNDLKELYEQLKKEFEITRTIKHEDREYADLIEKLYNDMIEINVISEKLRKNLRQEAKTTINTALTETKKLRNEIAINALLRYAERIYPEVGKISDVTKTELFRNNYEATVAILLYEFATGKGPEIRHFDFYEHKFAQAVLNGRMINEIMEETLKLLRQTNYDFVNKPNSKDLKIDLELSPTSKNYIVEALDKHLDSNLAQMFIGGGFALVRIKNKKLEGYIYNETGIESLLLHIADNVERQNIKSQKEAKLSTIKQRIYFTFKLPKN